MLIRDPSYQKTEAPKLKWIGERVRAHFPGRDDIVVLDIGCGDAPNHHLPGKVIGIDVQYDPYRIIDGGPAYVRWDLNRLPLPFDNESADAITMGDVIEHVDRPFELLQDAFRILRPNGLLVLSTPNPHYIQEVLNSWCGFNVPDAEDHRVHFPVANLKHYLNSIGFRVQQIRYYKVWIPFLKIFFLRVGMPAPLGYQYCLTAVRVSNVD